MKQMATMFLEIACSSFFHSVSNGSALFAGLHGFAGFTACQRLRNG
jgi:hypothetical protein